MAITMMVSREKATVEAIKSGQVYIVTNYPGHEVGFVTHKADCPNCSEANKAEAQKRGGWNYNKEKGYTQDNCLPGCSDWEPLYMEITYKGCVLSTYERNGSSDSDFYAIVWDEETQSTKSIEYATTRGWCYPNGASVDATDDVIEKAEAHQKQKDFEAWKRRNEEKSRIPEKGRQVKVIKGRKIKQGSEGVVFWYGKGRVFSRSRFATAPMRVGINIDGDKVFTDAGNVEVINPEQYLESEDNFHWQGAGNYRRAVRLPSGAVAY